MEKFEVRCPYCQHEPRLREFDRLDIWEDLYDFGKRVITCNACRMRYWIRLDDNGVPFVAC